MRACGIAHTKLDSASAKGPYLSRFVSVRRTSVGVRLPKSRSVSSSSLRGGSSKKCHQCPRTATGADLCTEGRWLDSLEMDSCRPRRTMATVDAHKPVGTCPFLRRSHVASTTWLRVKEAYHDDRICSSQGRLGFAQGVVQAKIAKGSQKI